MPGSVPMNAKMSRPLDGIFSIWVLSTPWAFSLLDNSMAAASAVTEI